MEKNMFDEYLYHVDVLFPVIPMLQRLAHPKRIQVKYQYVPLQQSKAIKSLIKVHYAPKSKYNTACIKCHELKKKCIWDSGSNDQCVGCKKRDIKCVIRKDGRKERFIKQRLAELGHCDFMKGPNF